VALVHKDTGKRCLSSRTGRGGVLSPYPEIVETIKDKLIGLRTSGICVQRLLARSIILAVIKDKRPQLLEKFKCSESHVSTFLESVMDWSVRHGTRAASHLPDNAHELCERAQEWLAQLRAIGDKFASEWLAKDAP
jgi:hypothetical protein